MNKIFLGAVFGLTIMGGAGASIISRGFFDEQIGNYATLDLLNSKANQSELNMLTGQISDSINDLLKPLWDGEARDLVSGFNPNKVDVDIYGAFWLIEGYLTFLSSGLINGWTDIKGTEFLGLKDVNTKIGDLPTKYKTVSAALSAIEGIAEEAKTLAEKAIPDPRAEGSSGKFVLTVDVIGDSATYHWEKIDRTLDETQQTLE